MSAARPAHPLWQSKSTAILYRALCDHEGKADVRVYVEDLYDKAAPARLLHKDFVSKFPNEVPQLWWEMFFANWLMEQPSLARITTPKNGPDFLADIGEQKVWIECTAPWPQGNAHRIDSSVFEYFSILNPADYILALTSAVHGKLDQIAAPIGSSLDVKLVAISLGTASDVDLIVGKSPPLLAQAFLGLSKSALQVPIVNGRGDLGQVTRIPTFRKSLEKSNGAHINTLGFLDGSLNKVSGVLFSSHRYNECPSVAESHFDFLHNPTAVVPCPRKLFRNVREYEVADGFLKEVS